MASKVETVCSEKISPLITKLGYEVIEINFSKKVDGMNLTFTIYSKNGITIEDCEKVHKVVSDELDKLNPTGDVHYILNVESEGLDRPIKSVQDFLRHKGQEYEVKLYKKVDKEKSFVGNLTEYNDEKVTLEIDGNERSFEKSAVAAVLPVIKF